MKNNLQQGRRTKLKIFDVEKIRFLIDPIHKAQGCSNAGNNFNNGRGAKNILGLEKNRI